MKHLPVTVPLIALVTLSGPALAGSMAPVTDPVVPAPIPLSQEWTGPYIGVELGFGDVTASSPNAQLGGDGMLYGITLGYDRDFGNWVLGLAIDYDRTDISLGGTDVDSIARLKLRAGVDLGDGLLYAVAGGARAETSVLGSDTGWTAGVGYEHRLSEHWSLGGEALYHEFKNFNGTGIDVDGTTVAIRALYRF